MVDYDSDYIKLYWQVEALKGQVQELERERNRTGNYLWGVRNLLIQALVGLGVEDNLTKKSDAEILRLFEKQLAENWVFSRCPNAEVLRCRPIAMKTTPDGDLIYCEDCGWDIRDNPPKLNIQKPYDNSPRNK